MSDNWRELSEIGNMIQFERARQWENIMIKTAKAYQNADETVRRFLPKGSSTDVDWGWKAMSTIFTGSVSMVITNPVGAGVALLLMTDGIKGIPGAEHEPVPDLPQFAIDPGKYQKFMEFHHNVALVKLAEKIRKAQQAARTGESGIDGDRLKKSLARSPLFHEPKDWDKFGTAEAEAEIEKMIWAQWLGEIDSESRRENVARAMQDDDMKRTSGDSRKSDGKYRHLTWQRLKAFGAFERFGAKLSTMTSAEVGGELPYGEYMFWFELAQKYWARNYRPDQYFYVGLVSPEAGRFFEDTMKAYEKQSISKKVAYYFSPSLASLRALVARVEP